MIRRVVVTGMGIVSPIGNDLPAFERNVMAGVAGIGWITRFDTTDHRVKIAAEVKDFDIEQYVERAEARRMDRFTRYAVAAAAQAMAHSGLTGRVAADRLGVYIGSGVGGMETFSEASEKLLNSGPRKVSPLFIPTMIANMAAGTVAIRCGAKGPCLPVVTACATSTHAIGEAYRTIRHGYADAILAGGTEATVTSLAIAGFTNCMALSTRNLPESSSIPFDKRRDGFVLGEGAAVLVLEDYEHAAARGATILAEVAGYGNTCDAYHITAPDPEAEGASAAIRQALAEAGYEPGMKVYYNAHGTSTPLNDKSETLALKKAFREQAVGLHISSTKSMTGHMLGAAGATEAVASILALRRDLVPPTVGYEEPDPECDLQYTPNQAVATPLDLAVSTSLGFGGHNGVLAFRKPV